MNFYETIKRINQKLKALIRYLLTAKDMSLEIGMAEKDFAKDFHDYLKAAGFETGHSQKRQACISRSSSFSIVHNIINAVPAIFEWEINSTDAKHSRLDVKFKLPFHLKIKLYICLAVMAFIHFGILPWFYQNTAGAEAFHTAIYKAVSHFLIVLSLFIFIFILALLERYKKYLHALIENFMCLAKKAPPNFIPFSESHHRLIEDFKLCITALLVTLLPAIREAKFSFSGVQILFLIIFGLVLLYLVCLVIGGMKGSLKFTRLSALTNNFTIAIITMAVLVLIPNLLYKISKQYHSLNASVQAEHNVSITQMLSDPDRYPQEAVVNAWDCIKAELVLIIAFQVIVCMIANMILYTLTYGKAPKFLGNATNRYIKNMFEKNSMSEDNKLALSSDMKTSVRKNFALLSAAIWIVLLLNIPIVIAFLFPGFTKLHIGYGKDIYSAIYGITNAVLAGSNFPYKQYAPMLLVSPMLLVFFNFVFGNIYYSLKDSFQYSFMRKVGGKTQNITDRIAGEMGVHKVHCLQDNRKSSCSYSPKAVISDIRRLNIIVFTDNSLKFLREKPYYAEAIIAHEIAHLKLHCAAIRETTINSRYGFVGSTFLSLLYDSITMEDEADREAKKYLVSHNMDENLVREAAWTIGKKYLWKNGFSGDIEQASFAALVPPNKTISGTRSIFIVDYILAIHNAYKLYFGLIPYDYIHRDARYR